MTNVNGVSQKAKDLVKQVAATEGNKTKIDTNKEVSILKAALETTCDETDKEYIKGFILEREKPETKPYPVKPKKPTKPKKSTPTPTPPRTGNTSRDNIYGNGNVAGNGNVTGNGNITGNGNVINIYNGYPPVAPPNGSTEQNPPTTGLTPPADQPEQIPPKDEKKVPQEINNLAIKYEKMKEDPDGPNDNKNGLNISEMQDCLNGYTSEANITEFNGYVNNITPQNVLAVIKEYNAEDSGDDNFFTQLQSEDWGNKREVASAEAVFRNVIYCLEDQIKIAEAYANNPDAMPEGAFLDPRNLQQAKNLLAQLKSHEIKHDDGGTTDSLVQRVSQLLKV